MQYGHWAVDVFIVLSGYCLMLPVVRSSDNHLRGGVIAYFVRRSRRIIPPYYAAILLSLLLIFIAHQLRKVGADNDYQANFSAPMLLSHIFLIHNLNLTWIYGVNPAMWSVATEWQIYFVFPLLLLPVWRRIGGVAAVVVGFAVGVAPHFLLPKNSNFDWVYPWYIGLFALGMAGASIGFSSRPMDISMRRGPWGYIALLLLTGIGMLVAIHSRIAENAYMIDFLVGLLTVSAIIYTTRCLTRGQNLSHPWFLRVCDAKVSLLLGSFSYSLYLIHVPIIHLLYCALSLAHLSSLLMFAVLIGTGLGASLLAAYFFSLVFERPFLSLARQQVKLPIGIAGA